MATEDWVCQDCNAVQPLNQHGRCSVCNSISVAPAAVLPQSSVPPVIKETDNMSKAQFMQAYHAATWENPIQNYERVWNNAVAFQISPHVSSSNTVRLNGIRSFIRGTGTGTLALRWLCTLADRYGVTLTGVVEPCGDKRPRLSRRQLAQWYRRHGFVVSADDHMYRFPKEEQAHGAGYSRESLPTRHTEGLQVL